MNNNLLAENELEKSAGGAITKRTWVTLDKDGNVVAKKTMHFLFRDDPYAPDGLGKPIIHITNKSDEIAANLARKAGVSDKIVEKRVETEIV